MSRHEFKEQLSDYIQCAFDNEQSFLDLFVPNAIPECNEIYSFHMASGRCFVKVKCKRKAEEWDLYPSTDDFIDWCESVAENNEALVTIHPGANQHMAKQVGAGTTTIRLPEGHNFDHLGDK